jgi:2-amino-4-hydroxy-6-hydroxymethyldihydropteridine diphosphokinase
MQDYYIGLGCNLIRRTDRARNIRAMLAALLRLAPALQVGRVVATAPVGVAADTPFYNGVVCLRSALQPVTLKTRLIAIETGLGRDRERCGQDCAEVPADLDVLCRLAPGSQPRAAQLPSEPYFRPLVLELWAYLGLMLPCPRLAIAGGVPLSVLGQGCGLRPTRLVNPRRAPTHLPEVLS